MKNWHLITPLVGLFFIAGCSDDPTKTKMVYMPDMVDSPAIKAQMGFLNPPPHSVARDAVLYPPSAEDSEIQLINPFAGKPGEDVHEAKGEELYGKFCTVCHGPDSKGGGQLLDVFPKPPDLTSDLYRPRKDGYFFHRITFGSLSGVMPSYGHAISVNERWEIILHLKKLQAKH